MLTQQDIRLRQAIWLEYRLGNDKQQALINTRKKFGTDSVSESLIDNIYSRFRPYKARIFDRMPEYYVTPVIQKLSNENEKDFIESILFFSRTCHLKSKMITLDGRFAIFKEFHSKNENYFVLCDLFYGEEKLVDMVSKLKLRNSGKFRMLNEENLLMRRGNDLLFLKIDYKSWKANVVELYRNILGEIVLNELDSRKFIVYNSKSFVTGSLTDGKITLSQKQRFDFLNFRLERLIGNQLLGFCTTSRQNNAEIPLWEFFEINLDTLTRQTVDVPMILNDNHFVKHICRAVYCWSGNQLYIPIYFDKHCVISFNIETRIWTNIGIEVYGEITSMFIDREYVLTLQADKSDSTFYPTFYRFPLKKPDSLKHLVWFKIVRDANLFGGTLFEKARNRSSFGTDIRSLFASE